MTGTILGGFTGRAVSASHRGGRGWHASFVVLAVLTGAWRR